MESLSVKRTGEKDFSVPSPSKSRRDDLFIEYQSSTPASFLFFSGAGNTLRLIRVRRPAPLKNKNEYLGAVSSINSSSLRDFKGQSPYGIGKSFVSAVLTSGVNAARPRRHWPVAETKTLAGH